MGDGGQREERGGEDEALLQCGQRTRSSNRRGRMQGRCSQHHRVCILPAVFTPSPPIARCPHPSRAVRARCGLPRPPLDVHAFPALSRPPRALPALSRPPRAIRGHRRLPRPPRDVPAHHALVAAFRAFPATSTPSPRCPAYHALSAVFTAFRVLPATSPRITRSSRPSALSRLSQAIRARRRLPRDVPALPALSPPISCYSRSSTPSALSPRYLHSLPPSTPSAQCPRPPSAVPAHHGVAALIVAFRALRATSAPSPHCYILSFHGFMYAHYPPAAPINIFFPTPACAK
ncbi:hypothetical protein PLICRDRAFT_176524 [Plicaturopsis crispa FD-325 SS-3]|nr:hypothetical protein PLICRDRAFT_176524 [Plicaturopsis crispa FD-325 SS-3]